jgi:hypothetical protein
MRYLTDGESTISVEDSQAALFLGARRGNGRPLWVETHPPKAEFPQTLVEAGTPTGVRLERDGHECFCTLAQLDTMQAQGWQPCDARPGDVTLKPLHPETPSSEPPPETPSSEPPPETPSSESPPETPSSESPLRKVLQSLEPQNDAFWNTDGQVNINTLRSMYPDATRAMVDSEWPGFSRETNRARG